MNTQEKNQNKILEALCTYSQNVGEDPLEYQGEVMEDVKGFVQWCKDKDYITEENYNRYTENDWEYELFQVVHEEEYEGLFKEDTDGWKALAEYISLSEERIQIFFDHFNTGGLI